MRNLFVVLAPDGRCCTCDNRKVASTQSATSLDRARWILGRWRAAGLPRRRLLVSAIIAPLALGPLVLLILTARLRTRQKPVIIVGETNGLSVLVDMCERGIRTWRQRLCLILILGPIDNCAVLSLYQQTQNIHVGRISASLHVSVLILPRWLVHIELYEHPLPESRVFALDLTHVYRTESTAVDISAVIADAVPAVTHRIGELGLLGFVCISLKSALHEETTTTPRKRGRYHARLSRTEDFVLGLRSLWSRGLLPVRVGVMEDPLPPDVAELMYDYAANSRTEHGDIWCAAACHFAVHDSTGYSWLALASNKPLLTTNCYDLRVRPYRPLDRFMPLQFWSTSDRHLLTLDQQLRLSWKTVRRTELERLGLEVVRNSPQLIADATLEMCDIIAGRSGSFDIDRVAFLRRRVNEMYETRGIPWRGKGEIAASFLLTNEGFLGI